MPQHIKSKSEYYTINIIAFMLIVLIAFIMISPQLYTHAFILGTDSNFHMNRFYDTAMQIKTGHFSYFQMLFGFARTGRIVNAIYGPLIAYIGGLILLGTHTWYNFELVTTLLELLGSGWFMYVLCEKSNIKRWASLLISALYMASYPVTIWITAQEFTGWGAVLMPLALLCGLKILNNHDINPIYFAFIMALLIETHLISSIIALFAIIPFFIIGEFHAQSKIKLLNHGVEALGLVLLLTGNVWGVVLDLFKTNHIIPIFPPQNITPGGCSFFNGYLKFLGPYLTIITIITIGLFLCNYKHCNYKTRVPLIIGLIFLWASTQYFPWTYISSIAKPLTNLIQFPRRLLVVAIILILVSFGKLVSISRTKHNLFHNRWAIGILTIILLILSVGQLHSELSTESDVYHSNAIFNQSTNMIHIINSNPKSIKAHFHTTHWSKSLIDNNKSTPDYLPTQHYISNHSYYDLHPYHFDNIDYELPYLNHTVIKVIHGRNTLIAKVNNTHVDKSQVIVPLTIYHQTKVIANHHIVKHPQITPAGALKLNAKHGRNTISIKFNPDKTMQIILIITIITWLFLISKVIL